MPCRYTLSRLRKDRNGASLAMYPLVGFASEAQSWASFWSPGKACPGGQGLGPWVDSCLLELPAFDSCFPGSPGLDSCLPGLPGLQSLVGPPGSFLPTNLLTLPARRLINTVSYHTRRNISHKETSHEQSNQPNKQTNERTNDGTNKRTSERKNARAKKQTSTQTSN